MKVYTVTGSTGTWDTHCKHLIGIYSTMWKAEMAREDAIIQRNEWLNKYTKEQQQKLEDRYEEWGDNEENRDEDMPADLREYSTWRYTDVFNEQIDIQEVEVDTTLLRM